MEGCRPGGSGQLKLTVLQHFIGKHLHKWAEPQLKVVKINRFYDMEYKALL